MAARKFTADDLARAFGTTPLPDDEIAKALLAGKKLRATYSMEEVWAAFEIKIDMDPRQYLGARAFDQSIAFNLDLHRLDAGERAKAIAVLDRLERDIVSRLSGHLTEWKRARVTKLLDESRSAIDRHYAELAESMLDTTSKLTPAAAEVSGAGLNILTPDGIAPILPTDAVMRQLAKRSIIVGATQADWWARQSADTAWRFQTAVEQGITASETNQEIIARVRKVIDVSQAHASTLVQTSIQTVANDARMETFEANKDLIKSYKWITALDSHVCPLCMERADKEWDADRSPIGHGIPFANPPIHYNDRCVLVAQTLSWEELSYGAVEVPVGTRASTSGPVAGDMTFMGFLERQSPEFVEDMFGKGRAALYQSGKITLHDLTSGNSRPLSVDQVAARAKKRA